MRIALFTDTFVPSMNGVARVLGLLVEHANRCGHQVGVVTPVIQEEEWPGTAFHLTLPGIELPFYREFKACLPYLDREGSDTLAAFRPDIVHSATEAPVGLAGRRWALERRVPFVSSYCTNFPEYMAGYGMGFLKAPVWAHLRRFHAPARLSFCPSRATRTQLEEQGFHRRFRIWGRGVDSDLFHPRRRRPSLRAEMAPGAEVILLFVGRMAPEKRVDLLLEAFRAIRRRATRRVALVFVGGGPEVSRLRDQGVEDVHFAGYRRGEELAAYYASADVFVFPSDTETFGQVVTEALSSGTPVVAPARGGVMDNVTPGRTGLLFRPGDVDDLVEKALALVEDADLRATMGRAGRSLAEGLSWDRIFQTLFHDYAEALNPRNSPVT